MTPRSARWTPRSPLVPRASAAWRDLMTSAARFAQAAKAVAKQYGLDRHEVYARALALKERA